MEINLRKPLLRGTKVKLNNEIVWVEFRYEQLLSFYFFGRMVGYQERMCERKVRDSTDSNICEGQYGEWMRVSGAVRVRRGALTDFNSRREGDVGRRLSLGR